MCLEGKRPSCALRAPLPLLWFHSSSGPRLENFTWSNSASVLEFLSLLNPMHPEALYPPAYFLSATLVPGTCSVYIRTVHLPCRSLLPPPATPVRWASKSSKSSPTKPRSLGLITDYCIYQRGFAIITLQTPPPLPFLEPQKP